MKKSNNNILGLLSFVALVIIALLMIVDVFAHFNILTIGGTVVNVLNTIKNVCLIIVIGFTAFDFVSNKKKWVKILFVISIIILIACTVLMWI